MVLVMKICCGSRWIFKTGELPSFFLPCVEYKRPQILTRNKGNDFLYPTTKTSQPVEPIHKPLLYIKRLLLLPRGVSLSPWEWKC
jgi:hypothetical protein